jgi:hypothetical protein
MAGVMACEKLVHALAQETFALEFLEIYELSAFQLQILTFYIPVGI